MIIVRTPFRVSLLGGSTDFANWYSHHGGLVVGGTVNHYSYIQARHLPPFHDYKTRVVYSSVETVKDNTEIQHKAVNAVLRFLGVHSGLEILHSADLPGRSGIGSSSSFVVGLLNAVGTLQGSRMTPAELADAAIKIEQVFLGETVGCQDQTFAAYGGMHAIRFRQNGDISPFPLALRKPEIESLEAHLMLFFTGVSRTSSEIAKTYAPSLQDRVTEQHAMMRLAEHGIDAVLRGDHERLGRLIDQSWRIKSGLAEGVNTAVTSDLYATAREHGAWGGKITGAGGGGMLLLVAPPERQAAIKGALVGKGATHIPFRFEFDGSRVIYANLVS